MSKISTINQDKFQSFLIWLDKDKDIAGQEYERIRQTLIRIFYARGCNIAEELADITIDRVIAKDEDFFKTYKGKPELFFYGVANKVFLEFTRNPKMEDLPDTITREEIDNEKLEDDFECLKHCLASIPSKQRELILKYYREDRQVKKSQRIKIMQRLGIENGTLRVRVFRIKNNLQKCISNCLEEKLEKRF